MLRYRSGRGAAAARGRRGKAAAGRPHSVDLLLCGHHFRASQAALTAAGAAVYDDTGALLAGGLSESEHNQRKHAAAA